MERVGEEEDKVKVKKPLVELTKKQLLNNHIVLMRKVIRQVKVHLINKLTKEVKRLKDRKGEEAAKEKAKRKVERVLKEIEVIKHLKEDRVTLFALKDKSKLNDVLQNPKSNTETRILSRFSNNKLVEAEVAKYRTHNPYWELQLPVLLEKSKDKRRRINKKLAEREQELLNRKEGLSTNKSALSKEEEEEVSLDSDSNNEAQGEAEELKEASSGSEEESVSDGKSKSLKVVSVSNSEIKISEEEKEDIKTKLNKTIKKKVLKSAIKAADARIRKSEGKAKKAVNSENKSANVGRSKSEGTVKVQFLKDLSDLEKSEENKSEVKLFVENNSRVPKPRPRSSFFVGGVEEVKEPENQQRPQNKGEGNRATRRKQEKQQPTEYKPVFKKGKLISKGPMRQNNDRSTRNQRNFNKEDNSNINYMPLGVKRDDKKPESSSKKVNSSSAQEEKLHPSWEAKKRQQPILSQFKGKKIKFNDD